jgi:hypothetical protein
MALKTGGCYSLWSSYMSGLIFLAALAFCIWGCVWLAKSLGNLVPNPALRTTTQVVIFIALLASPFVDELIGKNQFEALCKANGIESADVSKARGKRVKLEIGASQPLVSTIMPGRLEERVYRDADSGEVVIQHKDYYAFGGWLMRYTPLSMGSHHPMLFPGGCPIDYSDRNAIFIKNSITLIN